MSGVPELPVDVPDAAVGLALDADDWVVRAYMYRVIVHSVSLTVLGGKTK